MAENMKPPGPDEGITAFHRDPDAAEGLCILSRSPHPYRRTTHELLEPSNTVLARASSKPTRHDHQLLPFPLFTKEPTPVTESGTEADDETYVRKLPPSRTKSNKGLRGRNEVPSGPGTPLLTPVIDGDFEGFAAGEKIRIKEEYKRRKMTARKRNREMGRRGAEVAILGSLTWLVLRNPTVAPVAALWKHGE